MPYFQELRPVMQKLQKVVASANEDTPDSTEMHDKIISILEEAAESYPLVDNLTSVDILGTDKSTQFPIKGLVFKQQREAEEPANFVLTELDPRYFRFLTSIGDKYKQKGAKFQKSVLSEKTKREKDVFD